MNRRALLFAGLVLPMAAPVARAAGAVAVVYVGGQDCPYCSMWENRYKAQWLASPAFKQVIWIEVDVPHLREAYEERYWPGELKAVWEQIPSKNGTPRLPDRLQRQAGVQRRRRRPMGPRVAALKNVLG